jgi:hypothetical protein
MKQSKSTSLFSRPYYDPYKQCYQNIVTINLFPEGPLSTIVRKITFPPLSPFKEPNNCQRRINNCGLALTTLDFQGCNNLMCVDEVPDLISYLLSNGYKVDTNISQMFNTSDVRFDTNNANQFICFITYDG